jgi:hypothetical protein
MNETERAAFLMSQTACMLVEMEAMKAANRKRQMNDHSDAYGEDEFLALIEKYGTGHNAALTTLRGG